MKKSLVALAVFGAFAGAASAQSSVTLYGIVDVGYKYTDFKRDGAGSISSVNGGHQAGNRLGFRGSEAIGGGLNAVFTLEAGFDIDTGAFGQASTTNSTLGATTGTTRLFGRQAWAGLQGNFGTLVMGRIPTFSSGTGSFDMIGDFDPFITGYGIAGFHNSASSVNAQRIDNAVLYQTPTFGGFRAGAGYSFNTAGQEVAGSGNNRRLVFTGLRYAAGPLAAAVTYDMIKREIGGVSDQKHLQVGASWDFKFVKIMGTYAKEDNLTVAVTPISATNGTDADAYIVGLTAPVGPGLIRAAYQARDGDSGGTPVTERDGKGWAVGYIYNMSKRTDLYLTYADYKGEKSLAEGPAANDPFNQTQLTVGINHRF